MWRSERLFYYPRKSVHRQWKKKIIAKSTHPQLRSESKYRKKKKKNHSNRLRKTSVFRRKKIFLRVTRAYVSLRNTDRAIGKNVIFTRLVTTALSDVSKKADTATYHAGHPISFLNGWLASVFSTVVRRKMFTFRRSKRRVDDVLRTSATRAIISFVVLRFARRAGATRCLRSFVF